MDLANGPDGSIAQCVEMFPYPYAGNGAGVAQAIQVGLFSHGPLSRAVHSPTTLHSSQQPTNSWLEPWAGEGPAW